MNDIGIGRVLTPLGVLAVIAVAYFVMLRPLFPRNKKKRDAKKDEDDNRPVLDELSLVALEVAALISLAVGFPYGAFGLSSIFMLLGFSIALALRPQFTRPLIAVAMAVVAVTKLPAANINNLGLVVLAFLLMKLGFGVAKRLLGVGG